MSNNYKYYRYKAYSYRLRFNSEGNPDSGAVLLLDGAWIPINFGWDVIIKNCAPISEADAIFLAGIKREKYLLKNSLVNTRPN